MRTLPISLFISIILLATNVSLGLAFNQIKDFGQIVVTSQEILYLDLNEYFTGNIDSFGVEPPLRVPDKFELVNHQDKAFSTEEDIIIINSPKDNFGNWDLSQDWIFMDKGMQLHFCEQRGSSDAPTLSCDKDTDGPFWGDEEPEEKNCLYMHRMDPKTMVISCTPNKENGYARYFFYDVEDMRIISSFVERERGNRTRTVQLYSSYPKTIMLTYPKPDEGSTVGSTISLYDISDKEEVHFIKMITANYFSAQDFVIQRVIPIGGRTIYLAEKGGTVYRADNPELEKPGANNTFRIFDGNLLEMTAAWQTNHGQASTIVAIHSPKYVYYIDWTIANNPIPINKYPLSPIGEPVKKVKSLEVSQDFVSTVVSTANKPCTILVYYLGPSVPGDVYYKGECPKNTALMKTQRSGNSIFFVSSLDNIYDFHFYQIFPSILRINSTTVGKITNPLSINGKFHENLQITVIKPDDYSVYLASPGYQSSFGLVVPGKGSFEITSLLNGPFLTYTSNETDFTVLDPLGNISFTTTSKSDDNSIFTYYSDVTGNTIKWYSKFESNQSIVFQTCTRSGQKYKCTAKEPIEVEDEMFRIAASDAYFYAATENNIQIYDQALKKKRGEWNLPDGKSNDDDLLRCEQLLASQNPLVPFLYCVGSNGAYIYQTDNLGEQDGFKLNIECDDYKNASMTLNYKNPAILFLNCEKTIYFVDVFQWAMHDEYPIISTIEVIDKKHYGYSFGVSSKSLLLVLKETGSLLEYDIRNPRRPTLIKTHETIDYEHDQILSDSRNSDNIYILGKSKQTSNSVAIVYRSQFPGSSNYLTTIPLPNSRFDPAVPKIYPTFPAVKTADNEEIYLIPIGTQFGWTVRTKVQVNFASQDESDPTAVDYEKTIAILFTGKHAGMKPSFSIAQASLHMILTDESVRATQNLIYTGVKLAEETNHVLIDPRNVFNGTIKSYNVIAEDETEEKKVSVIQQVQKGDPIKLGATDVYKITMAGSTFIVQKSTAIVTIGEDGVSKELPIKSTNPLACDFIVYNSELEQTLTTCYDAKNSRYVFAFFTLSGTEAVGPIIVDTKDAGKVVASIQKALFTATAIYVLESIGTAGSFVHVFLYDSSDAKQKVQYATTIASSDLNIAYLSIADMTVNYKGTHDSYRLFLIDDDFGLRTIDIQIDMTFKTVLPVNPRSFPLGGPSNAYWNRVHIVREEGDLSSAIELVLSSPNFKTYYLKYYANQKDDALKILRVFVPLPNTYFTRICYADGSTFLLSASDGTKDYALLYSVSNVTSKSNAQNFPLLGEVYTPPVSGLCSFTFDPTPEKRHFYMHSDKDIANYTVSPNITMVIEGVITSKYITIEAVNGLHKDSFQYYLIPPPTDGLNPVFLYFMIGGVSVLVIIVLFCYFNIKSKKMNLYDYSLVSEDASAFQNDKP